MNSFQERREAGGGVFLRVKLLWLWIGLAGAVGALARYAVGTWMGYFSRGFPLGTFLVNVTGCFFFGVVWSMGQEESISADLRLILLAGFAGAFTTFSTYIFDMVELYGSQAWRPLVLATGGQLVLGTVAMVLGLRLGRAL